MPRESEVSRDLLVDDYDEAGEQTLRLAMLGQVAASAVHELHTLLAVVVQHTELLRRRIGNDAASEKTFALIHDAVRRGRRISEEILHFTRPHEPRLASIDAQRWLRDVAEEARGLVSDRTLLLELPRPLRIAADADQLSQVIFNLVTNARDATTAEGIITLGAARADAIPFVRKRVGEAEELAAIFVRDNGSGIPPEARARLFEPLFTTKPEGTGFGLATSRRIVARHGGRILVDSEPGAGSTFYVVLRRGGGER